jgi:hypothetical protein
MASRLRIAGRIAALAALALLMSACLKLDMDLEVTADNTVNGSVIFAVERSVLDLAGGSVEDFLGTDAPLPSDVPGVSVEDYDEGDFVGQRYTFDAVPLERFNEGSDPDQLSITREGDVFRVSGVLDLASGLTGTTGLTGIDPSEFLQGAELQIRLTFPGEVTETNGEADGNTVTWVPEFGERLELQATASAVGGGGDSNLTLWLIIGGVVVVLAIVAAVVLSQRRRGGPTPAMAGPAEAGMPAAGAPPATGVVEPPAPGVPPTAPPSAPTAPPPGPTSPPPPPPPEDA